MSTHYALESILFVSNALAIELNQFMLNIAIQTQYDNSKKYIKTINMNPNAVIIEQLSMSHVKPPLLDSVEITAYIIFDDIPSKSKLWQKLQIGDYLYLCFVADENRIVLLRRCQISKIFGGFSEELEDPKNHKTKNTTSLKRTLHVTLILFNIKMTC